MTLMTNKWLRGLLADGKVSLGLRAVIRHHILEEGSRLPSTVKVLAKCLLQQRDGATSYKDHAIRISRSHKKSTSVYVSV
jgi:hypothetical protein